MTKFQPQKEEGDPVVRPITKRNALGRPYDRMPAVEREIVDVVILDRESLLASASRLQDETLVYLIRERRRARDWQAAGQLSNVLVERCRGVLFKTLGSLPQDVRDEAIRTVLSQLFSQLAALDDRADFYEVRFAKALKRLSTSAFRQCVLTLAKQRLTESGDDLGEPDSRESSFNPYQWPDDALDFRDACAGLQAIRDERHRWAFFLHKVMDMPVKSDNPDVETVSGYLQTPTSTVNFWLQRAEADLDKWRRQQS